MNTAQFYMSRQGKNIHTRQVFHMINTVKTVEFIQPVCINTGTRML